ncbi:MAG TPA: hypothetical protein PKD54_00435 [Pirellulaceae bacterium]|nr:hypothetical protein [Pirellulaceae bacterium]
MKTVEQIETLLELAETAGYRIRYEVLGGVGGGICEFGGNKWLFVDLSLGPMDRLEQVRAALRTDPSLSTRAA